MACSFSDAMNPQFAEHRRPRILVAEDDEAIAQLIVGSLEEAGCETRWTKDGIETINSIFVNSYDLVILDLILPRLRGFEICQLVRGTTRLRSTPILIISGQDSDQSKLRLFELGADDYITKPFRIGELMAWVRVLLLRSRSARDDSSMSTLHQAA